MMRVSLVRLSWLALALLLVVSVIAAAAAANTVPATRMGSSTRPITVNDVKPAQCAAITLVNVVTCGAGGGSCDGTAQNDLVLGNVNADDIRGRGGNDCLMGGGGDDDIRGNNGGGDVCIGGPGTDTFRTCETSYQ